ncbi:sulfite exporter TauE/SafE family protein [Sinimarinibacterium sp. CAU 1509]|uniref:sulfite exporter TauE/SafE family protein n=1 Tax=Sinimarinibacterium sp. CAU 1509 TaxID=2562283 RepID=UPI0010ACE292|nr:TSUP family transporter [Sinimarinibacterium sp. CAU 1509]TJY61084.1 sulfite exporter TauE/SafE family protein [Sinimarinibacterium sp. CAU 1509]
MSPELLALCGLAFAAGFVDAVVGGGGLIQIPALFVLLPEVAPATLLGTNKFASIWGTASATLQYLRRVPLQWRATLPAAISALLFGFLGARTTAVLPAEAFRPLILILLIAVLVYTLWNKNLGALHAPRLSARQEIWVGLGVGAAIGFYDGFFGPGTGSFLVIAFVGLFGFSFLAASASAKIVNVITNLAALAYFVSAGNVRYDIALPMAMFNVAGATLGSRLAIRKGSLFVRRLFVTIVAVLILRFAWDLWRG